MKKGYINLLKERRSRYILNNTSPITKDKIKILVEEVMLHTPSAFNVPTFRLVFLFGKAHGDLWDITKEEIRKIIPDISAFSATERKMEMFKKSYGTILIFEDYDVVRELEEKYPLYKENFKEWSSQQTAMLQLGIWIAFSENGLGATLQHYNPIIDEEVNKRYDIPSSWRLSAQMPFGSYNEPDHEKELKEISDFVIIKN